MYGYVCGMDAGEQVGISAESPGGAALWHGSQGTFVDLHPPGTAYSYAYATKGGQQVGIVTPSGGSENYRAALWHGSNAWTNLSPAGALRSGAQATDGTLQGGWVDFPFGNSYVRHATLWSGSAESALDLSPTGSQGSAVLGMSPGQQVGWARPVGMLAEHAAIWSGSAQSVLDLHPIGNPGESHLNATIGWAQVGWSHVPGASFPHAGIWFGSASSFIDLQQFLPPGYSDSYAQAVDFYNGQLEVAGYAVNAQGYSEAFLPLARHPRARNEHDSGARGAPSGAASAAIAAHRLSPRSPTRAPPPART